MKIKKLLLTAAAALFCLSASAVSLDEVRIYINPGHGSWGPNNRHMATIGHDPIVSANPDTTDFYESNTNLQKGLALLYRLADYGVQFDKTKNQTNENPNRVGAALDLSNNIVMSHVKVGPWPCTGSADETDNGNEFNRNLEEICAEVEANNFDMFISIHSNAATDGNTVNYLAYFYRTDHGAPSDASIAMCQTSWNQRILDRHTKWTHYDYQVPSGGEGKIVNDLYRVIAHSCPGFLVEGYFHTYQPARHRAMNFDVDRMEGINYARGAADYFGWTKESTGDIYGIVRDQHEKFTHSLYKPNASTEDVYKPLNEVDVTLKQGEEVVATYKTDVNYNGAFIFRDLAPGEYTITFSHPDYLEAEPLPVVVEAAKTTYPNAYLVSTSYIPPKVTYYDYPDELTDGSVASDEYNVSEEYANLAIAELEGTTIRRVVLRGDVLYILAVDANKAPVLLAYDTKTKAVIEKLGTSACTNTTYMALADIQVTADGVLVGSSIGKGRYDSSVTEEKGEPFIPAVYYKWAVNEETGVATGEAQEWFTTSYSANLYRAYLGSTFLYKGTITDGFILQSAENASEGGSPWIWSTSITIVDGAMGTDATYYRPSHTRFADNGDADTYVYGSDYTYTLSPLHDNHYIISGTGCMPSESVISDKDAEIVPSLKVLADGILNKPAAKISFFKYAGSTFMVAPDEVDGKAVVKLINVTEGLDKATLVKVIVTSPETPTDLGALAYAAAAGRTAVEKNDEGAITNSYIDLHLVNGAAATKLTTNNVAQPIKRGEFAYDLDLTQEGTNYTATFKLTGDAQATVVVVDPNGNETEISTINGVEGENSVVIDATQLYDIAYTWKVVVESKEIPAAQVIFEDAQTSQGRGGVAIDKDPESDLFGNIYTSYSYGAGIQIFKPDLASQGMFATDQFLSGNSASPMRSTVSEGKLYAFDWSDPNGGVYVFDPANPTAAVTSFFEGSRASSGLWTNAAGESIASSCPGGVFVGKGEDRVLYAFMEDLGNILCRYDVGKADSWNKVPDATYSTISGLMANTNVTLYAIPEGILLGQIRNSGNNTDKVPGFAMMNYEGEVVFNSAGLDQLDGNAGAGLAVNDEGTLLAVANGAANINVYGIEWTDDVPAFTYKYQVPFEGASEINQMEFDIAGNLYAFGRAVGLKVYSLPTEAPIAVTPAKAALTITGTMGVDATVVDVAAKVIGGEGEIVVLGDAQKVSVYNVAGQAIAVNATTNKIEVPAGIYVVMLDGKAVKVVVK